MAKIGKRVAFRAAVVSLLFGFIVVVVHPDQRAVAAPEPLGPAAFTPMSPQRLVDTRIGLGAPMARLQSATSMDVQVTGRLGIPSNATAVVANVTAVDASGPGYLQVLPTGQADIGSASTLNIDAAGQTISNASFAPIGNDGQVTVYAIFTTDVVIDISGYFTPAVSSSAGRLVPLTPSRILDTRIALGWTPPEPPAPPLTNRPRTNGVAAATVITLQVAGRGVPLTGVSAVVMSVTAVDPLGAGFVQVAPTPVVAGASSNLNTSAGSTIANLVVVPMGGGGTVDLYITTPADLVADVVGYFTDQTAPDSSLGLFMPVAPSRQLDSRQSLSSPVPGGSVTRVDVNDISTSAIAVAGNLTATEATQPGYLQLAAMPVSPGASSNLNVAYVGQTIASAVVSPVAGGQLDLFNQNPTHELLDITGWFTSGQVAQQPPPSTGLGEFTAPLTIDSTYFPLVPGTRFVYDGVVTDDEGTHAHRVIFTVTDLIKPIDGVDTRVIWDRDLSDGTLSEAELAFFAQDRAQNVWTQGEYPEEYDGGSTAAPSTWISGVAGAKAGILVPGDPRLGTPAFDQGVATSIGFYDVGQVINTGQDVCVPTGCYSDVVVIDEFSPLDPLDGHQQKYYAPHVGLIKIDASSGDSQEVLTLTKIVQLGSSEMATARAAALALDTRAYSLADVYRDTGPAHP